MKRWRARWIATHFSETPFGGCHGFISQAMSLPAMQIWQKSPKPAVCSRFLGSHGFAVIQTHYRLDRNLNPTRVTSQTVNLANHGSLYQSSFGGHIRRRRRRNMPAGGPLHLETQAGGGHVLLEVVDRSGPERRGPSPR